MPDDSDALDSLEVSDSDGLASVAQLFGRARSAGTAEELRNERTIVTAMADVFTRSPGTLVAPAALQARSRRAGSKMAVRLAAIGAVVLVGASAAAATGQLPDDAQSFVARTTAHFGLRLPDPAAHTPSHDSTASAQDTTPQRSATPATPSTEDHTKNSNEVPSSSTATTSDSISPPTTVSTIPAAAAMTAASSSTDGASTAGPDPTGPAKHGLCEAWSAHQSNPSNAGPNAVSMASLTAAAADAGQSVEAFCAEVLFTEPEPAAPTSPPPPATEEENATKAKDNNQDDASPASASPTVPDTKKDKPQK